MAIEPEVLTTKASEFFSNFVDPQRRSAKTTVTIRDGETVVIGGLIDTEDEKVLRKVPFLGDIPLLGHLFSKKDDNSQDKELVIFITPHLIKDGPQTAELSAQELPWEDPDLGSKKDEAMEDVLDKFEQ